MKLTSEVEILLIYGSFTGNSAAAAEIIYQIFKNEKNFHITINNIWEDPIPKFENFDIIVFGGSTWFNGTPNPILEQYFVEVDPKKFKKKLKVVFFGTGDKTYTNYCTVIEFLEEQFSSHNKILPSLKIDGSIDTQNEIQIKKWSKKLIKAILSIYSP